MGCGVIKYVYGTSEDRAKVHRELFWLSVVLVPLAIAIKY